MPAKSASQRRLMAAALHGASFPKAKEVRASMTKEQLKDFATMEHESYQYDFRIDQYRYLVVV